MFVSTSIPYVNGRPHIGHALEFVQTDVITRYFRLLGHDTFFLTGTDENSLKNVRAAAKLGISTQALCDQNSTVFQELARQLNLSNTDFIRTSQELRHRNGAQKLWRRTRTEDIYKQHYTGRYCVDCEDFYTEKDTPDGLCPEHHAPLEMVAEENYFFRLSAYQAQLIELIESGTLRIAPTSRRNEMLAFAKAGLQDFSISRSRERASNWGIPVPDDANQVMYVWYDALANYITALDYADEGEYFQRYWNQADRRIHVIGKGINRFHTLYWPAMLLSADVRLPDVVFVHGYLTVNGQKMSKSLGNVVDPLDQIEQYGSEPVRYYLLRGVSPFEDGDYSEERVRELYNADLANNLGNLILRIETIGERAGYIVHDDAHPDAPVGFHQAMNEFRFQEAVGTLWSLATALNQRIDRTKPWELQKQQKTQELRTFLDEVVRDLHVLAYWLEPFLPETARTLRDRLQPGQSLQRGAPLFPRMN